MKARKNQHGFSILQVVIAASLFSVLGMSATSLLTSQMMVTMQLEDQLEKVELRRTLETTLKETSVCNSTFVGLQIPLNKQKINLDHITDASGQPLFSSNTEQGNIRIGQISLQNNNINSSVTTGFIDLSLPITRTRGLGVKELQPINTKLRVTVDSSRNIVNCSQSTVDFKLINAGVIAPSTPQQGVPLAVASPGVICFLAGVDDDVGNTFTVGHAVSYGEHKCRVGYNTSRSHWHGWAPLNGGQVSCSFMCFSVTTL